MAKAQADATALQPLQSANNDLKFTKVSMPMCTEALLCDTSTGMSRPYIPQQFRRTVFDSLRRLSHHSTTTYISFLLAWN